MVNRLLCAASLIGLAAGGAGAQPVPPFDGGEIIIVTGERVPRSLRETSSSVVVITDEMIETQSGDRVEDLLSLIPNIQFGSGSQGPTIRGQDSSGVLLDLPAFLGGTKPRVTLQVDGRALAYHEFIFGQAPVWDIEQIEVFRSPQTTTQGRNSIAGAIFVRTADPTYDWEAKGRVIGGNYGLRQGSALVSGPIVADQLAFRLSGDLRRGRPSSVLFDAIRGANPNNDDHGLVRFKLLAEPRAVPGLRIETSFVHLETLMPQVVGVRAPFKKRRDPIAFYGTFRTNVDSLTAEVRYEIAPTLTTTTILARGKSAIQRFAPPGVGEAIIAGSDFSIESLVDWKPSAALHLHGGVYRLRQHLDQAIDLTAILGTGDFVDDQASLGLFGEATIRPLPRLSITSGLRYQRDRQDRRGQLGTAQLSFPIDYDESFAEWLPKLSIAYDVTDDFTTGFLIQRAYNPGGVILNFDTGEQDEFGAETLWNYEAFARATFAGGRGTMSANAFFTDMKSAQRPRQRAYTVPGRPTAFWAEIDNVPKARSHGLEVELGWRANSTLSLRGGLGLLKTRIVESGNSALAIEGNGFQRSPKLTASAAVDWRPIEALRLSAQVRHNSGYYSDDANTPTRRIDGATVVNARATYDAGPATLFGFVRNVFDSFYMTSMSSPTTGTAGDPREFGVGLEARF